MCVNGRGEVGEGQSVKSPEPLRWLPVRPVFRQVSAERGVEDALAEYEQVCPPYRSYSHSVRV